MRTLTSPTIGPRRRPALRVGLALVLSLAVTLLTGGVADAASHSQPRNAPVIAGSRYLALGDSVTFGYEESAVVPAPNYSDASSLVGYPELLGSELHLKVANAACPGETSASMINPSAQSNGCENSPGKPGVGYRVSYPLHVSYTGSQLAYAISYLRSHHNVRLVSLMIGANDGLFCIETTSDGCSSASELDAVIQQVSSNVHHILHAIRHGARYRGQLVIVNYYSPLASFNTLSATLNQAVDAAAKPFDVVVADGYGIFQTAESHSGASPCTAGLLTQLGKPGSCGIHPSYAGQSLLAEAIERVIRL